MPDYGVVVMTERADRLAVKVAEATAVILERDCPGATVIHRTGKVSA
jgi:hypothetical protein